jgi:3-oxoacyl-[acyl-carrier protein] reductase
MMLENKTALIYGGGGAIGGAAARAFAGAGARVYLAGRTRTRLDKVAIDIGDAAEVAEVDARDELAVSEHADAVANEAGGIDIALNSVSFPFAAATPFADVTVDDVMHPIDTYLRTTVIIAKAAARHMTARRSGTILTLSAAASRFARPGNLGFGTTCAAIETMTQRLALELGPSGVRVVCLRPTAIADAPEHGSYTAKLFEPLAAAAGLSVEQLLVQWGHDITLLGRLPTLTEIAEAAVFLASDSAAAITGAVIDLTCGAAVRNSGQALVGLVD